MSKLQTWEKFHFAFAWFEPRDNVPIRIWYGSPTMMREWIETEKDLLAADLKLVDLMPEKVTDEIIDELLGGKDSYTYEDIKRVIKNQWNADAASGQPNLYKEYADVRASQRPGERLYSRDMAMRATKDRVRYLLARGSTTNNRKIPQSYVSRHCRELDRDGWAISLREAVQDFLNEREGSST